MGALAPFVESKLVRILSLAWVLSVSLLTGCAGLNTPVSFYQLNAETPAESTETKPVVFVKNLKVAEYLKSDVLVQRMAPHRLEHTQARWSTPLDQAINAQLLKQVGYGLDTQSVFTKAPANFDVAVEIWLERLDSGPHSPAVIEARWQLSDAHLEVRASRSVQLTEVHDGSLDDQVRAQSLLLSRLSAVLAQHIATLKPVAVEPPKALVPEKNERPTAKPARAVEVFRF